MKVGVLSDTHGLLRAEAVEALWGSDLIVHAGDVGRPEVLEALAEIAPVHAVRGNVDRGGWARDLPDTLWVEAGGAVLYVLHDLGDLDLAPEAAGIHVVVSGHSHKPALHQDAGVWYLNPGSTGPHRFRLPVSLARITVADDGTPSPELVILDPRG